MSGFPKRETVERLRAIYKKGTRVELENMDDIQAPPKGTRGTVMYVDDIGSVHVRWDTGSTLALAYGVDSAWILPSVTTKCAGKEQVWDSREDAMECFLDAMLECEGSESGRYALIYAKLKAGADYASDED